jgi:hypothetical protein
MKNILKVVICIDTEGPLTEKLTDTFKRVNNYFGTKFNPTKKKLKNLQSGIFEKKISKKMQSEIRDFVAPKRLNYLTNWKQVTRMIKDLTSSKFRSSTIKFFKKELVYSWFIIDNVGFKVNPRKKTIGFNKIFKKYLQILDKQSKKKDCIGWHFHSIHPSGDPLIYNTSWTTNDLHEKALCHKILDYKFFPQIFRSGAVIERNDINLWLENFIHFDFSNRSRKNIRNIEFLNDWSGAPSDWSFYNPSFYNFKKKGNMKRTIFRTLDIDTNSCVIEEKDIKKAFELSKKKGAILSVSTHDRRDIKPEISYFIKHLEKVSKKYPEIKVDFCNALEAAKYFTKKNIFKNKKYNMKISIKNKNILNIKTNFEIFGHTPFLAIKEKSGLVYRDNPIKTGKNEWKFLIREAISKIGIAISDQNANIYVKIHEM